MQYHTMALFNSGAPDTSEPVELQMRVEAHGTYVFIDVDLPNDGLHANYEANVIPPYGGEGETIGTRVPRLNELNDGRTIRFRYDGLTVNSGYRAVVRGASIS